MKYRNQEANIMRDVAFWSVSVEAFSPKHPPAPFKLITFSLRVSLWWRSSSDQSLLQCSALDHTLLLETHSPRPALMLLFPTSRY